jgi:hypothetical protein
MDPCVGLKMVGERSAKKHATFVHQVFHLVHDQNIEHARKPCLFHVSGLALMDSCQHR